MLEFREMTNTRILLVEDQEDSAQVLRAGLENLDPDFAVVQVSSAEEALRALQDSPFELLISDVLLPGISGLELMEQFRHYSPQSKIILISGVEDMETRREVAHAGAEAFFFKPLDLGDLLDAVERVLAMSTEETPASLDLNESDLKNARKQGNDIAIAISDLHEKLKSLSILLISERGQVMARAGKLPVDSIESTLMPDLMAAFFASLRIAVFVNSKLPDNLLCFRGNEYHLHLTSVSSSYALLVISKPQNSDRLSRLAEKSQIAVAKLADLLVEFELPYEPSLELFKDIQLGPKIKLDGELDPNLDGLLNRAETKPMSHRKAEKYWKSASQEILVHPARGGALTYEQARRLGLTPPDMK